MEHSPYLRRCRSYGKRMGTRLKLEIAKLASAEG
jgi:hypothetical protein